MRMVFVGCALILAASVESAAAQDGWPWTHYPSLRKQAAPKKRAQPPVPAKTEPAEAGAGRHCRAGSTKPIAAPGGTAGPAGRCTTAAGRPSSAATCS